MGEGDAIAPWKCRSHYIFISCNQLQVITERERQVKRI
jgi:hypothetical protein